MKLPNSFFLSTNVLFLFLFPNPLNSSHFSISIIEREEEEKDKEDEDEDEEKEDEDDLNEPETRRVTRFDPQKYLWMQKKRALKENGYYVVDYGKAYVERVIKTTLKMTFLQRNPDDMYDWPKKTDMDDDINFKYVFCGLLKLVGTTPYQIRGVNDAYMQYTKLRKGLAVLKQKINKKQKKLS